MITKTQNPIIQVHNISAEIGLTIYMYNTQE